MSVRSRRAVLSLLAAGLLVGCGLGRERSQRAEFLASWLDRQAYSTWYTFHRRARSPHTPASPDGLTLGSPNIFAAIGCDPKDLTSVQVLWGDHRTARPLAKPMTVSVTEGKKTRPLAEFAEQTLRRVRHTAIAVSRVEEDGLRLSCADFAPMGAEDNFLVRWFLVENTGGSPRRVRLRLDVPARAEWTKGKKGAWLQDNLAIVSDARLARSEDALEADLGRLRPGGAGEAAVMLVPVADTADLPAHAARARSALTSLPELLEETKSRWESWCAETPLVTGEKRMDDLLDSLLCLVLSHVGPEAIHTGSLRYPHDRAWVRDSYWVERALLELGMAKEARLSLDFFHRAWRASGVASYYRAPGGRAPGYGYGRVELPHYLVLMVKDAERLGGADGAAYWDMVQGCLDQAAPNGGLQPMNGDETWLLAAPVRELDDLLDNTWLLIASAEYGAELAGRLGDTDRAARYGQMAYQARLALRQFQPMEDQPAWYATGRGGDGSLDSLLCPEVYARGAMLGVLPAEDALISYGLLASWEQLSFERGIRTHARSATISGGTPGYVLHAAADDPVCDYQFNRELGQHAMRFASATGCVWEFHDLHDPAWGGEKRRLWDSAVLLTGLVHALFDVHRDASAVTFTPKPAPAAVLFERSAPPPPLDSRAAEALLADVGSALILHQASPEHAARIARELLRQVNRQVGVAAYPGQPPVGHPAIIISASPPQPGWRASYAGYWVREWEGPPQVWVVNKGDVYHDTEPLLCDLLSTLTPQREKPLPYPDANVDLTARWGEAPAGTAEVGAAAGSQTASGRLDLAGAELSLNPGEAEVRFQAAAAEGNMLDLTVALPRGAAQRVEASVTLPAGWWVVFARDMTGKWDRVEDPVRQLHLPDGRISLVYSFRPRGDPLTLTFNLARLHVGED